MEADMLDFTGQLLAQIPAFLLAEPICYIFAAIILGFVVDIINDLIKS